MDGFFGWLDEVVLNLGYVKNACLYYLINSPDDKGKGGNGKRTEPIDAFCRDLAWYKQFIAENAFNFEGFLESLHGESENEIGE